MIFFLILIRFFISLVIQTKGLLVLLYLAMEVLAASIMILQIDFMILSIFFEGLVLFTDL